MADAIGPPIKRALADQLREALVPVFDELQVEPYLIVRPTPPTIDVYGGDDPGQAAIAFGPNEVELYFTVRVRVGTPDHLAAQDLLDEFTDPEGDGSVTLAIHADPTLSGACGQAIVTAGPSGYQMFPMADGSGDLLGSSWRVTVTP